MANTITSEKDLLAICHFQKLEIEKLEETNAELLEALEWLLYETMYKNHPDASDAAKKAIAKAKGETSC